MRVEMCVYLEGSAAPIECKEDATPRETINTKFVFTREALLCKAVYVRALLGGPA